MAKKIYVSRGELIYKNPNTRIGRESYVCYDYTARAWVFNFGQSRSTYKYHTDVNDAVNDMRDCTCFGKSKIPSAMYVERVPTCWYCGDPANNYINKSIFGKTIADYWVCDAHLHVEAE